MSIIQIIQHGGGGRESVCGVLREKRYVVNSCIQHGGCHSFIEIYIHMKIPNSAQITLELYHILVNRVAKNKQNRVIFKHTVCIDH